MPCMGPSEQHAYELGDKAYNEIVGLLEETYGVSPKCNEQMVKINPVMKPHWEKAQADLKKAIQEYIWNDHCLGF